MPSSVINSDDGVVSGTSGLKTTGGDDGVLNIQNNGTTAVTVNASRNVGIGTTSPTTGLTLGSGKTITVQDGGSTSAPSFAVTTGGLGTSGMYVPAANTVALVAGATERVRIDSSGNLQFNSGYGSVATAYGCRAWVNFDGTGTPAIREDGNVSSITDNATGSFGINFTTAMPDANFAAICVAGNVNTGAQQFPISTMDNYSTTSVNLIVRQADNDNNTFVAADYDKNDVAIFR